MNVQGGVSNLLRSPTDQKAIFIFCINERNLAHLSSCHLSLLNLMFSLYNAIYELQYPWSSDDGLGHRAKLALDISLEDFALSSTS